MKAEMVWQIILTVALLITSAALFYTTHKLRNNKKTHPISELDARMDPGVLARAKKMAQEESLNVRLAILREKYGVRQNEIAAFTQTAVSKLENRKDIRISTLINYLDSLGMGLEITACPRNSVKKELLLRV